MAKEMEQQPPLPQAMDREFYDALYAELNEIQKKSEPGLPIVCH